MLLSLALAALMALMSSQAFAAQTHPYTGSSFGPDGVNGSANFTKLRSIAVDQASGNVFAYDAGDGGKIYKFDSSGAPANFSGLGGNVIKDVGDSGGGAEFEVAIAPPGSPGGAAGDIYVANNSNSLRIFSAAGAPLGEIAIGEETCGVAVDPAGHVFVGLYPSKVREYVPSASPVSEDDETDASTASLPGICNVAADALGNVYATNYGGSELVKLEGLGDSSPEVVDAAATIAVDPSTNDLYANRGNLFAQRTSSGNLIGTSGADRLSGSYGIAVHGASETIYAGNGDIKVDVFGPAIDVPGVEAEAPIVAVNKATLRATVNPAGLTVTECKFEFGTTVHYGQEKPCEGPIPSDSSDHPVTAKLLDLTPKTEYHFRIIVSNANGESSSPDLIFKTNQVATTRDATGTTAHETTLNGAVFPEGEAVTECKFEYGPSESLGEEGPCEGAIPTDDGEHPVTASLADLEVASSYFFRLTVVQAKGTFRGAIRDFVTNQPAETGNATEVTSSKATLAGVVFPEGKDVEDCKFEFGRFKTYGQTAPCEGAIPPDEGDHPVTAQLSHLAPGSPYHFRLVITRSDGVVLGEDRSFATEGTVFTGGSSAITDTTATVEGTLYPEGTPYTACTFEYGPSAAYGQSVACTESPSEIGEGSGPVLVHADLDALVRGSTYHYRLSSANAEGAFRGNDQIFTTFGARVEDEWAENVTPAEVTLKARINPAGASTTYHLEYGTDSSYGTSTPERNVGLDEEGHIVSNFLEGLTPGTTYYYRFVATGPLGSSEGLGRTFTTYRPFMPETVCPNQQHRTGASASLPDCRAYEMVSPVDKSNSDIRTSGNAFGLTTALNQAAGDGERFTYSSSRAFAGSPGSPYSNQYFATRTEGGWSTAAISPPEHPFLPKLSAWTLEAPFRGFTDNLDQAWFFNGNTDPLLPGATRGVVNLYKRENATGVLSTPDLASLGVGDGSISPFEGAELEGYSADGSHTIFSTVAITGFAMENSGQLYDLHEGQVKMVSLLPSGGPDTGDPFVGATPEQGRINLGKGGASLENAVSADGSHVFWTSFNNKGVSLEGVGRLYVRIDGERTEFVAANALFRGASTDGSRAFYLVGKGLPTELREFDVESQATRRIAGEVQGVMGFSDDGTTVYFVSQEDLADGATASGENLYVERDGSIELVAQLDPRDVRGEDRNSPGAVATYPLGRTSRVTPDGDFVTFQSTRSLTGYDNLATSSGAHVTEVFLYDAAAGKLTCASCDPSGARPRGHKYPRPFSANGDEYPQETLAASAWLPGFENSFHGSRVLSDDGKHLFFNSFDPLVPRDTNSQQDVYQWERAGSGSCRQPDGCIELISSGEGTVASQFVDADASGRNVFFTTSSSLLPQDTGLIDIYVAREGGGFAPISGPPAACEGEACQGPLSPPSDPAPNSANYSGSGNVRQKPSRHKGRKHRQRHKKSKKVKHQKNRHSSVGKGRTDSDRRTSR